MILHNFHRPCLALCRHAHYMLARKNITSLWLKTVSSSTWSKRSHFHANPLVTFGQPNYVPPSIVACNSSTAVCHLKPVDKIMLPELSELPVLNQNDVFTFENLNGMSSSRLADLTHSVQADVYTCLYENFHWLQPDRGYAFVQFAINGSTDEIFSPVSTHGGFKQMLDVIGNKVDSFENHDLVNIFINILMVGTDCAHPTMTKLIMRLYDLIPQMELRSLVDLNLFSRYLPRNDFFMTKLLIDRIDTILDGKTKDEPLSADDSSSLAIILSELPYGLVSRKHMEHYLVKILESVEYHPSVLNDVKVLSDMLRLSKRMFFGPLNSLTSKRICRQLSSLCCSALLNQVDSLTAFDIYKCCKRNFRKDIFFGRKLVHKIRDRGLALLPDVSRLSDLSNLSILFYQKNEFEYDVGETLFSEDMNSLMSEKLLSILSQTPYVDPLTLSNLAVNLIYIKSENKDVISVLQKHIIARFDRLFNFMKCYYRISGFLRFHPFIEDEDQDKYHMMLVNHIDHSAKRDRMLFRHIFSLIFLRVRHLSDEVLDKLINIIPNVGYSELASVASRVTLHTKKTFLKPQQKNRILKAIYDQIAADVNEVDDIEQLYFMARGLQSPQFTQDPTMNAIIMERFADFSGEMTDICFLKVAAIFHSNAYFHQKVYDDLANFVLNRKDNLSPKIVKQCLQTLAQVGYRPNNFDKLMKFCVSSIEEMFDETSVLLVLQQVESLCELQYYPEGLMLRIFNIDFIDRVDKILSDSRQKRFHPTLQNRFMNLNRMVVLECPEYDIPWFHDDYCKTLEREEPTQDARKQEMMYLIQSGLHQVLGGPKFLKRWAISPYYHNIDFEFALDKMSKPLEMKTLDNLDENSYQRWAVQVLMEDDYCSNIRQLKNEKRLLLKHLDLLGYRVIQVPHFEWNSMALTEWPAKLEFLKNKVYGESQDDVKSYKFS